MIEGMDERDPAVRGSNAAAAPRLRCRVTAVQVTTIVGVFDEDGNQIGVLQSPQPVVLFYPHATNLERLILEAERNAEKQITGPPP